MYAPSDVAAWFIDRIDREAGDSITHLKLQKLLYYAQAWSLVLLDRPLFAEEFQAWTHGPVLPSVYREYRRWGYDAIPASRAQPKLDAEVVRLLEDVQRIYGERSASALEGLTHAEAPWNRARGDLSPEAPSSEVIPAASMREFYSRMLTQTGGALVPHREEFESASPVFLGPDGRPLPPPGDDPYSDDDRDFDAVLHLGLRSLGRQG